MCFFFLIIIFFTIVALIPRNTIAYVPYGGDNLVHIYIFSILSLLLCLSKFILTKYVYLVLFFYGFLIEILQFIVGRILCTDILYNFIGIGLFVHLILFNFLEKFKILRFKYFYRKIDGKRSTY